MKNKNEFLWDINESGCVRKELIKCFYIEVGRIGFFNRKTYTIIAQCKGGGRFYFGTVKTPKEARDYIKDKTKEIEG